MGYETISLPSEAAVITPNKVTVAFDLIWSDFTANMIYAVIQQDWVYQSHLGNPSLPYWQDQCAFCYVYYNIINKLQWNLSITTT